MNIQERINYFADNMTPKFVKINIVKMSQTFKDIKRYVNKEIRGSRNLQFTSTDMRKWAIALNKVCKKMQRDTEFDKFSARLFEGGFPDTKQLKEVCIQTKSDLNLVLDLEVLVANINYYATVVYFLEERWKLLKQEDDELFNDIILAALVEAF